MLFTSPGLIRDIHSLAHNLPFYFEGSKDVDRCVVRLFTVPQVLPARKDLGMCSWCAGLVAAHTARISECEPTAGGKAKLCFR